MAPRPLAKLAQPGAEGPGLGRRALRARRRPPGLGIPAEKRASYAPYSPYIRGSRARISA